jgi:hypothetical protein
MKRHCLVFGIVVCLACAVVGATWTAAQEKPLDNAEIIKLTKLDMGDEVVIAKVKAARAVKFDTSTDDLVTLKEAGVSKVVIAAILERLAADMTTAATRAESGGEPKVTLRTADGTIELGPEYGIRKSDEGMGTGGFMAGGGSVRRWIEFHSDTAQIRLRERRPSLLLELTKDPRNAWWWVKLKQDERGDFRYIYLSSNAASGYTPEQRGSILGPLFDPDMGQNPILPVVQERPGLWRFTPARDLRPGEYGLFSGLVGEGILFSFGIDK